MYYKDGIVFGSVTAVKNNEKGVSLPTLMNDADIVALGYQVVTQTVQPVITAVQTTYQSGVDVLPDGSVETAWVINDMFADTPAILDVDGVTVLQPAMTKLEHETAYLTKLQADAMQVVVDHFTTVTTDFIQGKVDTYNKANGLAFKDIDAFTKYAVVLTSQHNAIANQFITYASDVWAAVRLYQSTAATIPTEAEFQVVLNSVVEPI